VRFGPFHVDRQRQQVYRGGNKLRLQGKVYQVLLVLIHNQGEVVTRDQLKQALWPADTHVNYDANVNTTVNKLRQALGESTEKPAYIETIPRRGYSFIGSAEFSDSPFPPQTDIAASAAQAGEGFTAPHVRSAKTSKRWLTLVIIGLILAGILLGAGAATFWITHFSPQLPH
jgi:DNA-binding winged helix-turn-helix (wHTH) protein